MSISKIVGVVVAAGVLAAPAQAAGFEPPVAEQELSTKSALALDPADEPGHNPAPPPAPAAVPGTGKADQGLAVPSRSSLTVPGEDGDKGKGKGGNGKGKHRTLGTDSGLGEGQR